MEKARKIIWTRAAMELLYEAVVTRFGPYKTWEKASSPGRGLDDEYHKFCAMFASVAGSKSGEAVEHQIAWAMPIPRGSVRDLDASYGRQFILNTACAYYGGFISNADFPETMRSLVELAKERSA